MRKHKACKYTVYDSLICLDIGETTHIEVLDLQSTAKERNILW